MVFIEIAFWILLAGFFAGLETGIYSVNKLRLRLQMEQDKIKSNIKVLSNLLKDKEGLIYMTLLYTNLGVHLASATATTYIETFSLPIRSDILATLFLTPFIFIFSETVPKNIFCNKADFLLYKLPFIITFFKYLFLPFIWVLKAVIEFFFFFIAKEENSEENDLNRVQISRILSLESQENALTSYQKNIASKIMKMEEVGVEKVMIPFHQVAVLPKDFAMQDIMEKTRSTGFTRFPVYDTKEEKVLGIANFYDVYYTDMDEKKYPLHSVVYIQNNRSVREALNLSSRHKKPMLVVVNSSQKILGIVTVKDLIKYFVGVLPAW